jgi:hypothetical protein
VLGGRNVSLTTTLPERMNEVGAVPLGALNKVTDIPKGIEKLGVAVANIVLTGELYTLK